MVLRRRLWLRRGWVLCGTCSFRWRVWSVLLEGGSVWTWFRRSYLLVVCFFLRSSSWCPSGRGSGFPVETFVLWETPFWTGFLSSVLLRGWVRCVVLGTTNLLLVNHGWRGVFLLRRTTSCTCVVRVGWGWRFVWSINWWCWFFLCRWLLFSSAGCRWSDWFLRCVLLLYSFRVGFLSFSSFNVCWLWIRSSG